MKLAVNVFKKFGRTFGSAREEILVGDDASYSKPYVVRASDASWIPLNVLVFAESEDEAKDIVHEGLKLTLEESSEEDWIHYERYRKILELFEKPGTVEVEEYDMRYVCKLGWDTRGL